jgi:hypothetical protein
MGTSARSLACAVLYSTRNDDDKRRIFFAMGTYSTIQHLANCVRVIVYWRPLQKMMFSSAFVFGKMLSLQ